MKPNGDQPTAVRTEAECIPQISKPKTPESKPGAKSDVKPAAKPDAKPDAKDKLKTMPLPEVEKKLSRRRRPQSGRGQETADPYGPNELEEKKTNPFLKFLSYFWGPIPWMIEAAVVLSAVARHWPDFVIIFLLLLTNAVVGFWEERQAGNAIAALKAKLAIRRPREAGCERITPPARELVPGDVIRVRLGDIVPADARLLEGDPMEVDQSALTGSRCPPRASPARPCFPVRSSVRAKAAPWCTPPARTPTLGRRPHSCRRHIPSAIFRRRF